MLRFLTFVLSSGAMFKVGQLSLERFQACHWFLLASLVPSKPPAGLHLATMQLDLTPI